MSLRETIQDIPPKKLALGVIGGVVISIVLLLAINTLFFGYPMDPAVYQYSYPNGTGPMTPISTDSVQIHASGSALTTPAYAVNYSERTTYTAANGSEQVLSETSIDYQINNAESIGYLERVTRGDTATANHYEYYETENDSYLHYPVNNTTSWEATGESPRVLTNQLKLPQAMVESVPHIDWSVTGPETIDGNEYLTYTATSASASQMPSIDSVTSVDGELRVNKRTNIISFNVSVEGTTTLDSGETVSVTKTQSLDWTALDNSTVPAEPQWVDESLSQSDSGSDNDSDDGWEPGY